MKLYIIFILIIIIILIIKKKAEKSRMTKKRNHFNDSQNKHFINTIVNNSYVINMDKDHKRLEVFTKYMNALNIPFERIKGVDGKQIYEKYKDNGFVVLGVPSNQFGGQEPGTNDEIKNFCETNFNITFPIMDKVDVKGENAHILYKWAKENYGNSTIPKWNFHKILINKDGKIEETFNSFTSPISKKITNVLEKIL